MTQNDNKKSDKALKKNEKHKEPGVAKRAYKQLKTWLIAGRWKPEDCLPSEAILSQELGVSRNSLQTALKLLNTTGAIETVKGSGSHVNKDFAPYMLRDDTNLVIRLKPREFSDMLEFRQNVELQCAGLAAARATRGDMVALTRALKAMKAQQHDPTEFSKAESEFHFALIDATHNTIWIRAMNAIRGDYHAYLAELNEGGVFAENVVAHEALYLALKDQDSDAALRAMTTVLAQAAHTSDIVAQNRADNKSVQSPIIFDGE
ncbi:FCD domain-containing protein [Buttiauxella selenatireducens]|uniref:FCD domain-containing protein n=1 Tax=Buttiauxella selenatireducens TaxID=3073902 RepID=A0ABY9S5X0_9ENTR|nr:FCD domain-containing protein [Buttiauxella sp. R73]WMY72521.1 FCD domain-containing protein [Buttiauxella sp. R73]